MADVTHGVGRRQYSDRSDRIIQNVLPSIALLDEDIAQAGFLTFFSKASNITTPTERFEWDVDEFLATSDTLNGAVSGTTATTITVDNPTYFISGQLWTNKRTGEVLMIKGVNVSSSQLSVQRQVTALNSGGGTAAAAMLDADVLVRLGPATGENTQRQPTQTTIPNQVFNFTQQIRWELALSRRQVKRQFEQGPEKGYLDNKHLKEARKQLNGIFIAGERGRYTDADEGDITTTAGIRSVVTTNTFAVGGTLYEYALDQFLVEEGLRKGSPTKLMIASTNVILAISEMTKDRVTHQFLDLTPKKGGIGVQVMNYTAPNGHMLTILEDRFLSENYNGEAIIIDLSEIKRRTFSNNGVSDDLHIIQGTQDNEDLGRTDTLFGDMGLQYGAEEAHARITGVTAGAKGRAVA